MSDPYEERDDAQHSTRSNEMYHATVERAPAEPTASEAEQQSVGDSDSVVYIECYKYTAKKAHRGKEKQVPVWMLFYAGDRVASIPRGVYDVVLEHAPVQNGVVPKNPRSTIPSNTKYFFMLDMHSPYN